MRKYIIQILNDVFGYFISPFRTVFEWGKKSPVECIGTIIAAFVFVIVINNVNFSRDITTQKPIKKHITYTTKLFENDHKLRKIKTRINNESSFSGGYFLFAGSVSGSSKQTPTITFSWEMNGGDYAICEMKLSKIRVRLDSSVVQPYIKFKWIPCDPYYKDDMSFLVSNFVRYAVIVCKEEDYDIDVDLNEL